MQDQGLFAQVILKTICDAEDPPSATDTRQKVKAANRIPICRPPLGHQLAYGNVHNGTCQLLYAPLQLHLCRRKAFQIQLLAIEEQEIKKCFNKKFELLRIDKDKLICKIEEQLARVSAIQTELGATQYPADIVPVSEEEESRWIRVEPHELTATKWLSLAERCASGEQQLYIACCVLTHDSACECFPSWPPVQAAPQGRSKTNS